MPPRRGKAQEKQQVSFSAASHLYTSIQHCAVMRHVPTDQDPNEPRRPKNAYMFYLAEALTQTLVSFFSPHAPSVLDGHAHTHTRRMLSHIHTCVYTLIHAHTLFPAGGQSKRKVPDGHFPAHDQTMAGSLPRKEATVFRQSQIGNGRIHDCQRIIHRLLLIRVISNTNQ